MSGVLYEALTLRVAYCDLVHHCCIRGGRNVEDVSAAEALLGMRQMGKMRCAAYLYVTRVADSTADGMDIVERLWDMLAAGRVPMTMYDAAGAFPEAARPGQEQPDTRRGPLRRLKGWLESKLVADEETSAWMDRADREQRLREGKQP